MRLTKPDASPTRSQRGVVLLLALIMLVAMTLAGIVLYRQIGTGLIIARNLNFKRTAAVASDRGLEVARAWLIDQTAAQLEQASAADGYFPGWCNTVLNAVGVPDADEDGKIAAITRHRRNSIPRPTTGTSPFPPWRPPTTASATRSAMSSIACAKHRGR